MLHGFFASASQNASVLALGTGRSPELDLLAPKGPIDVAKWVVADDDPSEDAVHRKDSSSRVERRVAALPDAIAAAAAKQKSFDLIYTVDALDTMTDGEAVSVIEQATGLLTPNGRIIVSAFAPELPEQLTSTAYSTGGRASATN